MGQHKSFLSLYNITAIGTDIYVHINYLRIELYATNFTLINKQQNAVRRNNSPGVPS